MSFAKKDEKYETPVQNKRVATEARIYSRRIARRGHRRVTNSDTIVNPLKPSRSKDKYSGPSSVIIDNGAYTTKIGMSSAKAPSVIPNCIMKVKSERKRFFIGNQIDECRDLSGLYYLLPCEKGYIVKWNVQKPVWDYMFNNACSVEGKPVILTQPLFNFKAIQEITDEIFFEEYEVKSLFRVNPSDLARYEYITNVVGRNVSCVIVDSGFSFTTIIPYIGGKKYYSAARRINVGGKMLTNHLKDIISYRQLHVMDETYVINQAKEDTCYVSLNFKDDMKIASQHGPQNTIVKNYVLPDFNNIRRGYIQESGNDATNTEGCQILRLNNERFTVPEILFHPSDIGMESIGIAECIVKCIKLCPAKEQSHLSKHIVLIGGNTNFSGYKERLQAEVRSYLPDHWTVNVYKPENPTTFAWNGGKSLSEDSKFKSLLITKEQYEEMGSSYTYGRFSDWVHSKKDEQDAPKTTKSEVNVSSILDNAKFTRFDLFGKHESETEDICVVDDDNAEADKLVKDGSLETSKSNDSSSNLDVLKEDETDNSNTIRDSTIEMQGEDITESNLRINEKGGKNKSLYNVSAIPMESPNSDFIDCYDFNVLSNSFV